MLDSKIIIKDIEKSKARLATRGKNMDYLEELVTLENNRKAIIAEVEQLKAKRNQLSREIGIAKRQKQDVAPMLNEVSSLVNKLLN